MKNQVQFIFHLGARTDTTEKSVEIFNELNLNYSKEVWNLCVEYGICIDLRKLGSYLWRPERWDIATPHELVEKLMPLNPYGDSKNDFDKWAIQQERAPYFFAGLKFFNVYGPNENHKNRMASVVLHTFRQVNKTGKMKLFKSHRDDYLDGHQTRDFYFRRGRLRCLYASDAWAVKHRERFIQRRLRQCKNIFRFSDRLLLSQ